MTLKSEYQLKAHQLHGVETALKRDGNIILSHPVGSGKTLSSIAVFEKLKEQGLANRALVVTPASLRTNYGDNGIKKFTDSDYVVYGNKQENASDKTGTFNEPTDIGPEYGLVSYEMFREDPEKYIKGHKADTVIFDEVHRIKNDESKTFKALKNSRGMFRNFIGMTGSVVSNTPSDVVPLIDAMTGGNHNLGTKAAFENRFVSVDKEGNKIVQNKILVKALLAPYVHNVTEEVIHNSGSGKPPTAIYNDVIVPLEGRHEEYYRYVIDQLDPITKLKLKHGVGKVGKAQMDAIFAKLLKARQVANSIHMINPEMSLEESANESGKVKKLLDDVEEHLNTVSDAQVVIHSELLKGGIDVLEAGLKQRGIEYGKFIGKGNQGVTEKSRQQDVSDYNSGKKKVILLSSAGGEGLDLPNTTMVANLDLHWNPERISQVEARGIRMGGLSHRPEEDRKVIVNRYITKLPISKLDTAKNTYQLLSPGAIVGRIWNNEQLFFNPIKSNPTVDQMMYQTAKQKSVGNEQLKSLFEKTAAFSVSSDKEILNKYLQKYEDKLVTGDYNNTWIDEAGENKYINQLKAYYAGARKKDIIRIAPKDYESMKDTSGFKQGMKRGLITGGLFAAVMPLYSPPIGRVLLNGSTRDRLIAGGIVGTGSLILGSIAAKSVLKPHVTTSSAEAGKMLKLTDEQLRNILRGESITTEEVKTKQQFIKMK